MAIFLYRPGDIVWMTGRYWAGHVGVEALYADRTGLWYRTRNPLSDLGITTWVRAQTFERITRIASVAV